MTLIKASELYAKQLDKIKDQVYTHDHDLSWAKEMGLKVEKITLATPKDIIQDHEFARPRISRRLARSKLG